MNQDVDRYLPFGYSVKLKQQKILEAVVIVKFTSAAMLHTLHTVSLQQRCCHWEIILLQVFFKNARKIDADNLAETLESRKMVEEARLIGKITFFCGRFRC